MTPFAAVGCVFLRTALRREAEVLDQQACRVIEKLLHVLTPDVGQILTRRRFKLAAVPAVGQASVGVDTVCYPLLAVTEDFDFVLVAIRRSENAHKLGK